MRRYHIVLIIIAILAIVYLALGYIPARATLLYGPPARAGRLPVGSGTEPRLTANQRDRGSLRSRRGDHRR